MPDEVGDLVFNGVSSDVYRSSFVNGLQGDGAYRVGGGHTLRAGFTVSGEKTETVNSSIIEPLDANGNPIDAPFGVTRPEFQARLARRRLCAGRMEDHRPADAELRAALRSDVAVRR